MAAALLTGIFIGLAGLGTTAVLGLLGTDITRHVSYGIFSTMITLLAHSMMMFYLIGKGKAVKDAMAEHQLTADYVRRIAAARKPVFSMATLAMMVTMVAAMKKLDMTVTYIEVAGGNHTDVVVPNLPKAFEFLAQQRKAAAATQR